jgi:outer membrane protein insertion porin family
MLKSLRLSLSMLLAFCFIPAASWGLETVRVAVLPFEVNALEGRDYLEERLPQVIQSYLEQEGAEIVDISGEIGAGPGAIKGRAAELRRIGAAADAAYVIWGSLTRIGQNISIDAKMTATEASAATMPFYAEGRGVENLSVMVQKLVGEMSLRLFQRQTVARIEVSGNQRIEEDAIKKVIRIREGEAFLPKALSDDIKNVYNMGYFDDIKVKSEDAPEGKILIFEVKEKPTVRRVQITGNRIFDDKEVKEALSIRRGSILNIYMVKSNIKRIESMYKEKNYHNVQVNYDVLPLEKNQADLEFVIEEGGKVRVREIRFQGNQAYDDDELKKIMKTTEKGFWSWITSSGELNLDNLNQDASLLSAHYHNSGYVDAKVGSPEVTYEGDWIYITIKIDEGARYKVGNVTMTGDLILPEADFLGSLNITRQEYYSREVVRGDMLRLTDIYADEGYAYADISPMIQKNDEALSVDIAYNIRQGDQVRFEKIIISGNTKTRDKVIRRQLTVLEDGLYSGRKLKRSVANLTRLDYFEDIKVDTIKGSSDDKMILKLDVTEKPTGTFTFGGGYSSTENLFIMAAISQRNLFGRGQTLQLRGELGSQTTRYTLSFTEPWLYDIPLSAGFDLYNWDREYDTYTKDSVGGAIRFGYPVWNYTRAYLSYRYDVSDITEITEDASQDVKDLAGENTTSAILATLRYDSRDRAFNPTKGAFHELSFEYAGLGGDIGFTKIVGELSQYIPLFWSTVGHLRGRGGYVTESSGKILPDYEKFYLGGIDTVRGYEWQEISLFDEDGAEIGGNKFIQFNAEYIFPLIKKAGMVGVVFFDAGNVYAESDTIDFGDLRTSAGAGIRWYSPVGPIRIEYGYKLDREDGEDPGKWEFAMGSAF